jgi:hypothetical protein
VQLWSVVFVVSQALPQVPQLARLVAVSVSQPSSIAPGCGPLQSPKLPVQV